MRVTTIAYFGKYRRRNFRVTYTREGDGCKAVCDYAGNHYSWDKVRWRPSQSDAAACVRACARSDDSL